MLDTLMGLLAPHWIRTGRRRTRCAALTTGAVLELARYGRKVGAN
jgi:hypothetical protein